ncbi:MAG: thioredoxin domain-containing protein [Deltaproteobacteria bacterium]|jgi:protein-disulfide isomerase|nr:thioredoxin domain-containing protein [Deltaproteobacteria bacterium]
MRLSALAVALTLSAPLVTAPLAGCASRSEHADEGASPAGPGASDRAATAAIVDGKKITLGELDKGIEEQLAGARATYEMAVFEARKGALEAKIDELVVAAEAKKRNVTVEALVAQEVTARIPELGEEELKTFYEQYKSQMDGAGFEDMKDQIRSYLSKERQKTRERSFYNDLRKASGVKIVLDAPRTKVEAKGPTRGPADAKVTIVVFSDFECPFCVRSIPTLEQVEKTWPKDVKVVFRNYPLPFHEAARPAAEAASCAGEQGHFWELHDHFFHGGDLDLAKARGVLTAIAGFDVARYDTCLSSGRGAEIVRADQAAAEKVSVDGTPAFFINGIRLSGARPFEDFETVINSELSR